ncbi:unnamed protein product [Caenorhabditis sp. 36 PRJEB53466]|nr:unnamed protein product [Caenorhabditis sp. 36 PRJEB53466]
MPIREEARKGPGAVFGIGVTNSWIKKGKKMSSGALADIARHINRRDQDVSPRTSERFISNSLRVLDNPNNDKCAALRCELARIFRTGEEVVSRGVIEQPTFTYPDQLQQYTTHLANSAQEGADVANRYFFGANSHGSNIYLDTESAYGGKTALVQIADPSSKRLLLWRVGREDRNGDEQVIRILREISNYRTVYTYGEEKLLKDNEIIANDAQRVIFTRDGRRVSESLADAAKRRFGQHFVLHKTESLSDWDRNSLRTDQITYASMDAAILAYLI